MGNGGKDLSDNGTKARKKGQLGGGTGRIEVYIVDYQYFIRLG